MIRPQPRHAAQPPAGALPPVALPPAVEQPAVEKRQPVIRLVSVVKTYGTGEAAVQALRGVSLDVHERDYVAIVGASGSGKSTMMNIIGCLDVPSEGQFLIDGIDTSALDEQQLAVLRNRKIGFVFQAFNLIPRMTALANVELPLSYAGVRGAERRRRAEAALRVTGLAERMQFQPNQLSGGQQQRVAVSRALVTAPSLVLADEPTGNLDTKASQELMAVFDRLNVAGRTIVLITHEADVAAHAKRVIGFQDGHIVADRRVAEPGALPPLLGQPLLGQPVLGQPVPGPVPP
jgi:putative ABC transport system ATP-binding protein